MKIFLVLCLATGLASTDKLDRTYLPPPGSKFSGGSSGDIQVPFEFPKETYSTERPLPGDGSPESGFGINKPKPTESAQKPGFTYFQNSYSVPTTTTSYAITQTTTFGPTEVDEELQQPSGFLNGSTTQNSGFPKYPQTGQTSQRRPNKGQPSHSTNYNQYQQPQNDLPSYGSTTQRPQFPSNLIGLQYLPPVSDLGSKEQPIIGQDNNGYPAGLPKGPQYQDGQQFSPTSRPIITKPGFTSGPIQQNQFNGVPNSPISTVSPQYQNGRFGSTTGPISSQQASGFSGDTEHFPSSTTAPQYQGGQRFSTPGSIGQQQYVGNQQFPQRFSTTRPFVQNEYPGIQNIPSSTFAPQYPDEQRLSIPGSIGQNQLIDNQNFPSSTAVPQYQNGQRFTTSGPDEQKQYVGNQNFPSSTAAPHYEIGQRFTTPGPVGQRQYIGNQNFPSSAAVPQYQNGQRFTTPGSEISTPGLIGQNQYLGGQNLPSSIAPQYQGAQRFSTTGPVGQNQFVGSQNFPSSTAAPQYQNGQSNTTPGAVQQSFGSRVPIQNQFPGSQNVPSSTTPPPYQNRQEFTSPGSAQLNQFSGNQNLPSTTAPQYQDGQRFTTPGTIPDRTQPNLYFPSSTTTPQSQNGPQFTTPGPVQQNQFFGNQNIPSTSIPQYQNGQRINTSAAPQGFGPTIGQRYQGPPQGNQRYPSTAAPQYQQTLAPTPGSTQLGFIPNQNINQYPGQPGYNQQFPSTTTTQGFAPELQQYGNDGIQSVPGTTVSFPAIQSTPGTQTPPSYGNQPISSQTGTGSQVYGTTPSPSLNYQGFPSTALPISDFPSIPGSGGYAQNRPERPQAAFDRTAEILDFKNVQTPEGYSYSYDTSNGIHADETGVVGNGTRAQGGFSYTGDDGKIYSIFYSADENGFQPVGDHLPTPPPIPEAIQRVIEQANMDRESGISDDGSYNEDKYGYMKYNRPLTGHRLKNKTKPLINGADIPNRYGYDDTEQSQMQPKQKGGNRYNYSGENNTNESEDVNEQGQVDDEVYDDDSSNNQEVKHISSKRPTSIKTSARDKNHDNNKNNFENDFMIKRPVGGNRRPSSEENGDDNEFETNMAENGEHLQGSQEIDEDESDLVNYRDDPNSRTDFHGLNKYLPRPSSNKKRPLGRPDRINESTTENKKAGRPENRRPQLSQDSQDAVIDDQQDLTDPDYKRIPSRTQNFSQKMRGQSNDPTGDSSKSDSNHESGTHNESKTEDNEDFLSDVESAPKVQSNRHHTYQTGKNNVSKPTRPIGKENYGTNNQNTKVIDEETGYEYAPPQRKFESGGTVTFSPRISVTEKPRLSQKVQKGVQTTLRPFMTPNVYDDDKEAIEEEDDQIDSQGQPHGPSRHQQEKYPGYNKENVQNNQNPELTDDGNDETRKPSGQYGTIPIRRPNGRPQISTEQGINEENRYNRPSHNQGFRRPSNRPIYGNYVPSNGVSKVESNSFVSTTPLSSSGSDTIKEYKRPGQYQTTLKPSDGLPYYDTTAPGKDGNIPNYIPKRPILENNRGQGPSTTFRPNYSFGDRTLAPSGSITVDGFGRPISTKAPDYNPTYSVTEGGRIPNSEGLTSNQATPVEEKFRPSVGRFGVTSAPTLGTPGLYQGSTSAPIGEDFSGPKQPPRFDSETGYHYK